MEDIFNSVNKEKNELVPQMPSPTQHSQASLSSLAEAQFQSLGTMTQRVSGLGGTAECGMATLKTEQVKVYILNVETASLPRPAL